LPTATATSSSNSAEHDAFIFEVLEEVVLWQPVKGVGVGQEACEASDRCTIEISSPGVGKPYICAEQRVEIISRCHDTSWYALVSPEASLPSWH
jgi:hypothetical protein